MARAHFVKAARKDYPDAGIKKGESYYWWAFMQGGRGGPKRFSKTKPKASQLTQSEFWSAVYGVQENAENTPSYEEIESGAIDDIISELESIRDDVQGKWDNLPENFQNGESGDRLQARVEALDEAVSNLQSIDTEFEEPDVEKEADESDDDFEERRDEEIEQGKQNRAEDIWIEVQDILAGISCE